MMIIGQDSHDQGRLRVGLVILVLGVLLMLWSWGSWAYRLSAERPDPRIGVTETAVIEPTAEQAHAAGAMRYFLIVALAIGLIGLFGSYILLRMSRQFRESASRSRAAPTPYQDVWATHQKPDDEP